jgi:hypothetical protein
LAGGEGGGEDEAEEALESEKIPAALVLRDAFFLKSVHTSSTPELSSESVRSLDFLDAARMERRISS